MKRLLVSVAGIVACVCSSTLLAQNCDMVLLSTRSYDKTRLDSREYFHSLNAIDSSSSSMGATNESAMLGPLAIARDSIQSEKTKVKQTFDVNYSSEESFETIKMQTPPQAIDAWLRCKESRDVPYLEVVVLGEPDALDFQGFLYWMPPAYAFGRRLANVASINAQIELTGVSSDGSIPQGKTAVRFKRARKGDPISGLVTGTFGAESLGANFKIPAWKTQCPTAAQKRCSGRVLTDVTPLGVAGCDDVKVSTAPENVALNQVYWLAISAFGERKECKPTGGATVLRAGATCSVVVGDVRWTATLASLTPTEPKYPAYIDVSVACVNN